MKKEELRYLQRLAELYPTIAKASTEIINLQSILNLPKGTEHFMSDIHGEYDAFSHVLRNGSGAVRKKIDDVFGHTLSNSDKRSLATLIYYPKEKMEVVKKQEEDMENWYKITLYRLIEVCKTTASKYTRSKVRKALPADYAYVIEELITEKAEVLDKEAYYDAIVNTIIEIGRAENFIIALAELIQRLVVDHLHVLGDIYDRGPGPHFIMDRLMKYHSLDIQWGNHDVVWMGAACGNWACIANIIRMNVSYNNFDMLEYGYSINLRPLATLAEKIYKGDECKAFWPHVLDKNRFDPIPEDLAAKMHKMIAICQFKIEGQIIQAHPEMHLEKRLLLDKIDFENGTVEVEGTVYPLKDANLPTIDPADPYRLSPEEEEVMIALEASILRSDKLQEHIQFLYSHGALYKTLNGNLMFHGCIPFTEDGEFRDVTINGITQHGAKLMEYLDKELRDAYFNPPKGKTRAEAANLMWYLWLGPDSPLFGKDKMTTFERLFIADKATHKEHVVPYYRLINQKDICVKMIRDFGLDASHGKILNGHVPVKIKDGESPIKGGGMLYVIDGGISKAYQKTTGIAGYTFIFNSRFMALSEHQPYQPLRPDGTQEFNNPVIQTVYTLPQRMLIVDTDNGKAIREQIDDLEQLLQAYRKGSIKEVYPKKGKYYSKN